jgi:ABC-type branched-subunit amino acid transport system ATPase component
MTTPILEIKGVSKDFGGVKALQGIDLVGIRGEVHGLIGPNGSGKSTLIGCITGVNRIEKGEILFRGQRIDRMSVHRRARLGIARTFQKIRLAQQLTVFENVAAALAACWFTSLSGYLRIFTSLSSKDIANPVYAALEAVGIAELAREQVASLPYGKRHFVELARALVSRPAVILLDEPASGLTEVERETLAALVRRIASSGVLVVLVEHDLELVGRLCDRVTVIEYGRRIFHGNPTDAQQDPQVVRAYLGSSKFAREETNRVPAA